MANARVLVLRAPGTNCDVETAHAFEQSGGTAERVHINRLREQPHLVHDYQILCIPGGFSYGDDIAAGSILARQLQHHVGDAVREFYQQGKLILGICNGFQVLLKSGVLLPPDAEGARGTLAWNNSGRFLDRWVNTRVNNQKCVFLRGIESMYLPIAHAEGRFVARNSDVLGGLEQDGLLALQYCSPDGGKASGSPDNPNGSVADVAGICDSTGRVFGLMPHPERHLDATNHPNWTRRKVQPDEGDGMAIFRNAVEFFA